MRKAPEGNRPRATNSTVPCVSSVIAVRRILSPNHFTRDSATSVRSSGRVSGAQVFATTLRQVNNTNSHNWGAIMLEGDTWHVVEPREIHVLDRIGGGDGFVGGLLYAVLKGWEPEKWIQFGWASGALATTFLTDYGQPADEEQVWSIWQGNARVKR